MVKWGYLTRFSGCRIIRKIQVHDPISLAFGTSPESLSASVRVSAALRLLGARPSDMLELHGPMPGRVAKALGFASRQAFLDAYAERRDAVRAAYLEAMT